ncbi:histidine kinase [Actinoallomurus bryophytorum]|uniref:histidine kinase n=1 Tax=Actinoallomurus bryophytorum TaxID=1490222 RepID=A0A543CSU1_9ACTN|nr:signal transduction histidine kinase [Actinoallomurus bryophytorum]
MPAGALCAVCLAPVAGPAGAIMAAAAVATVPAALWRPRWTPALAGLAAVVSLTADLVTPSPVSHRVVLTIAVELVALVVQVALVIRRAPARYAIPLGALTATAAIVLPLRFTLRQPAPRLDDAVVPCAMASFMVICAVAVSGYLRLLDHRKNAAIQAARRAQRLELAGDLHDFVAHDVTGIVVAAQSLLAGPFDSEQAEAVLQSIEKAGMQALSSMDRTVHALRETEAGHERPRATHGVADLPELVGRFSATGTTRAYLNAHPDAGDTLPREVADTAYRIVVEALTNVRRHAPDATRADVVLAMDEEGRLSIEVTDDGQAMLRQRPSGGTGLAGLTERVAVLGGALDAGPHLSGWRLTATLPARRRIP